MRFSKMTVDEARSAPRRARIESPSELEASPVMLDDTWVPPDALWNEAELDPTWSGRSVDSQEGAWSARRSSWAHEVYDFREPFID